MAYQFIQDALAQAAGDASITEIRVAEGTYRPDDPGGTGSRAATVLLRRLIARPTLMAMAMWMRQFLPPCSARGVEQDRRAWQSGLSFFRVGRYVDVAPVNSGSIDVIRRASQRCRVVNCCQLRHCNGRKA